MKKETRFDRAKLFEDFQASGKAMFEEFAQKDTKHKKFDDYYTLCICPRGRNGGISRRLFEVFYGDRIFDKEEKLRSDFSSQEKLLTEHGTTLSFGLNDHGNVAVILYPSGTEYTKSIESAIFVENYIHPKKLKNKRFLKRQWIYFNAYMENKSIDGHPTMIDKAIYSYLRISKNLVIDDKFQEQKIATYLWSTLKFVFTVGLSGFLIFLFTILPNRNDSISIKENKQLMEINNSLNVIIKYHKQDSIRNSKLNKKDTTRKKMILQKK